MTDPISTDTSERLRMLLKQPCWSQRSSFPTSQPMSDRVASLGGGLFLIMNPVAKGGGLVVAAGWAESDYWAARALDLPFKGELTPPEGQWRPPPSLVFLGRPQSLSFRSVKAFEEPRTGKNNVLLVTAHYRWTDGAFLYVTVNGSDGVTYMYQSNNPKPADEPVAIQVGLRERKTGWLGRLLGRSGQA